MFIRIISTKQQYRYISFLWVIHERCGQGQLIGARFESHFLHKVSHNYCTVHSVRTKCVVVVLYRTVGVRQLLSYRHRIVETIEMYSMLIQGDTEGTCQIWWVYEIM